MDVSELRGALAIVGIKLPQWQVRKILEDWDTDTSGPDKGTLSFKEFKNVSNEKGRLLLPRRHNVTNEFWCQ